MGAQAVPPASGRHPEALGVVICCALRGCQQCAAHLQRQHCHISMCADASHMHKEGSQARREALMNIKLRLWPGGWGNKVS